MSRWQLMLRCGSIVMIHVAPAFLFFIVIIFGRVARIGDSSITVDIFCISVLIFYLHITYGKCVYDIIFKETKRFKGKIINVEKNIHRTALINTEVFFNHGKYIDDENKEIEAKDVQIFNCSYEPFLKKLVHRKEVEIVYLKKSKIIVDIKNMRQSNRN